MCRTTTNNKLHNNNNGITTNKTSCRGLHLKFKTFKMIKDLDYFLWFTLWQAFFMNRLSNGILCNCIAITKQILTTRGVQHSLIITVRSNLILLRSVWSKHDLR